MFCILILACLAALVSPAGAEYVVPSYPQRPPLVRAVRAELPESAELGATIPVRIEAERQPGVSDPLRCYLSLAKDGLVYHVQTIPAPGTAAAGASLGPYMVNIPDDIPAGHYQYRVGVYLDTAQAVGSIRLSGQCSVSDPIVVTTGCFTDKLGVPHHWHINHAHTLIWDGEPFIPAGGMFIYDRDWNLVKAQLDLLKQYGVLDIYLHLGVNQPYPWKDYSDDDYAFFQKTIDYLDDNGFTYGIEFQALEAKGPGYSYPGGGARVDNVTSGTTVRVEEKGARSAVFIVCDNATGQIVQTGTARVDGDFLEADVVTPREGDYRVVFAADRPGPNDFVMYYWGDEYQRYVEKVRSHYSKVRLGPGFRFVADPLWNEMNTSHNFVPSAPAFAEQFARWLEKRYGSIEELNRAWRSLGAPWPTFSAAGSTISIERIEDKLTGKLMQYAYSRDAKRFYTMEACASQFNYDVREFIGRSLLYYCNDIADQWKKLNDVPVIYKGFSDVDWWHINDTGLTSGHDGLGMESYGNGEPMLLFMAAHLFGECEQAAKTTWLIVTETGEGNHQDVCLSRNKPIGYTDRLGTMYANFNALISGGAKGIYQYNMIGGRNVQEPWTDNISRDPRQLEWLATYARVLRNAAPLVDYKPDMYFRFPALFNPCGMELYSEPCADFYNMGGWWWREPIERSQNNLWIVPSFSLRPRTPMLIVNLENAPASERFARELTDAVESGKRVTMIGFRRDRSVIPIIDRYYADRFAINERGRKFQALRPTPSSRVLGVTAKGEVWNLVDGNLQINSEEVFGRNGYQPQNLAFGDERPIDPYHGVFADLLGVTLLDLGPDLDAFTFVDGGVPITVVSTRGSETTLTVQIDDDVTCAYPDGSDAGERRGHILSVPLAPVDRRLVQARSDWAPEGIMVDSIRAIDTVIVEGLDGRAARFPSALEAVKAESERIVSRLPEDAGQAFAAELARARVRGDIATRDYISGIRESTEEFFSGITPYVWIEAENAVSHNFNYSRLGAIPSLSGCAFIGLETAVEPPTDTGWYAAYDLDIPQDGVYQLWVRENYLSFCSPCSYRIDDGEWVHVSNLLVPHDIRIVTQYNAIEDTRQVFAWYHYGGMRIAAGRHRLTVRVDEPRPQGTVLTMADNRRYAKLIDCLALTRRAFAPDGARRPRYLIDEAQSPMLNLLVNPSMEFDSTGDGRCDGWRPSQDSGLEWTKPGWGNIRAEGLFDINLQLRDSYAQLRSLRIEPGPEERVWSSDPVDPGNADSFLASVWIRADGPSARARVRWLDASGRTVRLDILLNDGDGEEWREVSEELTKPVSAVSAVFECVLEADAPGPARFDDAVFAAIRKTG